MYKQTEQWFCDVCGKEMLKSERIYMQVPIIETLKNGDVYCNNRYVEVCEQCGKIVAPIVGKNKETGLYELRENKLDWWEKLQ